MKLVKVIEKNELLVSDWGIYKLDEEERRAFGNNYALSQGTISEWALEEMGPNKLLSGLRAYAYEGFFETKKEAYLQVKLVEMLCKIDRLESAIAKLDVVRKLETPRW